MFVLYIEAFDSPAMSDTDGKPNLDTLAQMLRDAADKMTAHGITSAILRDDDGVSVGRFHLID